MRPADGGRWSAIGGGRRRPPRGTRLRRRSIERRCRRSGVDRELLLILLSATPLARHHNFPRFPSSAAMRVATTPTRAGRRVRARYRQSDVSPVVKALVKALVAELAVASVVEYSSLHV